MSETILGFINRDFNYLSIITWVPLNENGGGRNIFTDHCQQAAGHMLYHVYSE